MFILIKRERKKALLPFSRLNREGITQIIITCHTIKNNDTNRISLMNGDVNYWKIHPQASLALKWIGFLFGYCIDCIFLKFKLKRPLWIANLLYIISDFNTRTGLNSYGSQSGNWKSCALSFVSDAHLSVGWFLELFSRMELLRALFCFCQFCTFIPKRCDVII